MRKMKMLLAACLCWSSLAAAEIKIGVVDLRAALFSSEKAKEFSEDLQREFKSEEDRIRAVGAEAQKLQDRLKKDSAILSESERSKLAAELEEKAQEFNYLKNRFESAVAKRKQNFLQESKPRLDKALEEIVKKEKLQLILPREATLYTGQSLDYTTQLIDILNRQ